jgi:hypothetical protein
MRLERAVIWRQWARLALWGAGFALGFAIWFLPFPASVVFYLALVIGLFLMWSLGSVDEEDQAE